MLKRKLEERNCKCKTPCEIRLIKKANSEYSGKFFYGCSNWSSTKGCEYFEIVEEYIEDGFDRLDGYIVLPNTENIKVDIGLPIELLKVVFYYVGVKDYYRKCTKICKFWRSLSFDKDTMKQCFGTSDVWKYIGSLKCWRISLIFYSLDEFIGDFLKQWKEPKILEYLHDEITNISRRRRLIKKRNVIGSKVIHSIQVNLKKEMDIMDFIKQYVIPNNHTVKKNKKQSYLYIGIAFIEILETDPIIRSIEVIDFDGTNLDLDHQLEKWCTRMDIPKKFKQINFSLHVLQICKLKSEDNSLFSFPQYLNNLQKMVHYFNL